MSEESMDNFQGIHASVITALRCSKTRVWNSAGPQIFSQTPELHTRNSAGLRTLDWNAITWQNSRPRIPPDSRTLIPESAGLQNSEPGIHRNPEFRASVTRNSGGLRPESKPDLEFRWNSAGIPGLFLLGPTVSLFQSQKLFPAKHKKSPSHKIKLPQKSSATW